MSYWQAHPSVTSRFSSVPGPTYTGDPYTLPAFFEKMERYAKLTRMSDDEKIHYVSRVAVQTDTDYLMWTYIASYCDENWPMFREEIMSGYRQRVAYVSSCRRRIPEERVRLNNLVVETKAEDEDESDSDSDSDDSDTISIFSNSDSTSSDSESTTSDDDESDDEDMFGEDDDTDSDKLINSQAYFEQVESYRRYQKHMAKRRGRHALRRARVELR